MLYRCSVCLEVVIKLVLHVRNHAYRSYKSVNARNVLSGTRGAKQCKILWIAECDGRSVITGHAENPAAGWSSCLP